MDNRQRYTMEEWKQMIRERREVQGLATKTAKEGTSAASSLDRQKAALPCRINILDD